jgi:HEAT repeat protein
MKRAGDTLMEMVVNTGDDGTAHALLQAFFSGYPVPELRRLLQSPDDRTARIGAWIASELGWRARPMLPELSLLLTHPSKYVRFHAVDSILAAATAEDGEAIGAAIQLIEDRDEAVRWKALNFLARATHGQLRAALPSLSASPLGPLTRWLLESDQMLGTGQVLTRLDDYEILVRLFAVAAACRISAQDRSPLLYAAEATDTEVSSFAKEQLEAIAEDAA